MSNNNELHAAILDECLNEVAEKRAFSRKVIGGGPTDHSPLECKEAALISLQRLTAFYEWLSQNGWIKPSWSPERDWYNNPKRDLDSHIAELYTKYQESLKTKP